MVGAIEIIDWHKIEEAPPAYVAWAVHVLVDEMFEINYHVPIEVKPVNFETYLDEHYADVLALGKRIYGPILSEPTKIVGLHIEIKKIKEKLKV